MEASLQERHAPKNRCFGCGPANEKGLRIKSFRDPAGGLWELRPRVAFGWRTFPDTTTRWRFDED